MTYRLKLNQVKQVLGMTIKFETAKLIDGVTVLEYEKLEPGFEVYIVAEDGSKTLAPAGEHMLEDGITEIEVDENGIIMEVSMEEAEAEEEVVEVSGSKKFEEEEKISVAMEEAIKEMAKKLAEEKVAEVIDEKMKMVFEVVEEVAKEVATIKEEMTAFKSKFEKFAKSPAASAPNAAATPVAHKLDAFEQKLEVIKSVMNK